MLIMRYKSHQYHIWCKPIQWQRSWYRQQGWRDMPRCYCDL